MKKILSKFAMFVSVLGFAATASAANVYFDFNGDMLADSNWQVADFVSPITADLYIDGIDLSHGGLLGFGMNVSYDPLVASATMASVANPPWTISVPAVLTPGNVLLEGLLFFGSTPPGDVSGSPIALGSVEFAATDAFTLVSSDKSQLTIDFAGVDGFNYDPVINFQTASVSAVPLPGAALLFGSGLLGLVGLKRKRGKKITS